MNITVMGLGYVGSVISACLSKTHHITGVDIAKNKVDLINAGKSAVVEPEIDDLIRDGHMEGRLKGIYDRDYRIDSTDVIIVCVGTPSCLFGEVDLSSLIHVTEFIITLLKETEKKPAVIYRSTVLPGTMKEVVLSLYNKSFSEIDFPIIYHPEFLRESSAIKDFFENPQVVVAPVAGIDADGAENLTKKIYKDIVYRFYCVNIKTAEMIKYLNNTFHALKVAFANEIARICSSEDIDTHSLFRIFMDDDKLNISRAYLAPGFAYGGSCLTKDVKALTLLAQQQHVDMPIVSHIERSNDVHIHCAFQEILESGLNRIGFYGLSFKADTDDFRESAYVKLIENLLGKGKEIRIFDELINLNTIMGKNQEYLVEHIPHISKLLVGSMDELIGHSDLIVLCHYNRKIIDRCKDENSIILMDTTGKLGMEDLSQNIRSLIFA